MSWNPNGLCRGIEGGIISLASAAGAAAAAEREIDRSGQAAVAQLSRALRVERSVRIATEQKLADTEAELLYVYELLETERLKLRSSTR